MIYATCMCIMFSVLALVNISDLGSLSPEKVPKRAFLICIFGSIAYWSGFVAFHDDDVSHCCCTHHCQGGNQMIISTMQYPGQGMSYDSVYRQRDLQPPLPADWMKTATMWQFAVGAEKYHEKPPILDNKK